MKKNTITFDNGNHAVVVTAGRDTDAQTILRTLDLAQPHALIMVFGGAKDSTIRGKLVLPNCSPTQSHRRRLRSVRLLSTAALSPA